MKIADYNQMMAYLTRPEPLPQPKPEELLDLQEQKRKDRLRKTMEEIGSGLMDESVDFIERENFDIGSKPKITLEELKKILNQSKNISDTETAKILNKKYSTPRYGKKFNSSNVQALRYSLGVATETGKERLGESKIEKVRKYLAKEITKANDGDKFVSKQEIVKKAVIKFNIKTGAAQAKQKAGPRFRLDPGTYPILNTLESTEQKLDTVLKRMLMDDKPLGDLWYKTLVKRTGLSRDAVSKSLKAGKVPTYNTIKDQGADLITDRLSTGYSKNILSELSFSDQLIKANSLAEGRPIITYGANVGASYQPKYTIMNFAFRNWDQNLGKGPIKFFDKKGKLIPWKFGKELKGPDVSFSYKGKKYNLAKLSDTDVLKKDFAEAYKTINNATALKNKEVDNPFKPGSKIKVRDLVKQIQVDGYKWSPNFGTIDVLHGPKGVKNEPFTNLRFNTRDINMVEMALNNSLRAGNITQSQFNTSIKKLNEPFKGLTGKDYEQAIIDRLGVQADKIKKEKFYGFEDFKTLVSAIACPDAVKKADGGRVDFQDGTSCFEKGKKMINTGKIPEGAGQRNFIKFANKAMEIGKQSYRGLRTFAKFGIIPEAIFIGADTLIRTQMGDTLDEAFKRATDFYRTDNSYEQANKLEVLRRMDPTNAGLILNLRKFKSEQDKLSSLEQQKEAELALAGDDFAETNIGETEEEIEKRYAPQLQKQENNLFNATISDAEERAGLKAETEFADKKGVAYKKSPIGKVLDVYAEAPSIKPIVDLFATEARGEPDVSAQVLQNYFEGKLDSDESKNLQNIIRSNKAKGVLDALKKIEAAEPPTEDEPSIFDEERKILFDLAKTDTALAERLGGASMTFFGDPIDSTDLQDEMNLDRGIYALGGRIGFAKGPSDPSRRYFMKVMAGIMSIPVVGKFLKPAAKVVPVVQDGVKLGADKLMLLVDKIRKLGTDVTPKLSTQERERVLTYQGKDGSEYELYEDLTTGDIRVERNKTGVGSYEDKTYDTIEDKTTFEIRKGEEIVKDEGMETQKTIQAPDEYEEGKAIFDQDGTVSDFDEVDDSTIKAIEDEIN